MKFNKLIKHTLKSFLGYKSEGIGIILTRRCNLSCHYCKIKNNDILPENELSLKQWQIIIAKLIKNKHQHFIFTGGEPLLYPDIFKLIDSTSKNALTSLITNTYLLSETVFTKLKNLNFLTFSIDTFTENESLQKNTLKQLPLIAENCKKYKINPAAIITITKQNVLDIPMIIKELTKYKIPALLSIIHSDKYDTFDFRGYSPNLEFTTNDDFKNLELLQTTLLQMKKEKFLIAERNEFIKNMILFCKGNYQIKCPACDKFLTIDYTGNIKACHDIPASKINALTFTNYTEMKQEVKKTIPANCNCYYDCYFNSQYSLTNRLFHHISRI